MLKTCEAILLVINHGIIDYAHVTPSQTAVTDSPTLSDIFIYRPIISRRNQSAVTIETTALEDT